jgi:hypothetical protein
VLQPLANTNYSLPSTNLTLLQTFIEQKEFVLVQYVDMAKELLDKLTPSTNHINVHGIHLSIAAHSNELFRVVGGLCEEGQEALPLPNVHSLFRSTFL